MDKAGKAYWDSTNHQNKVWEYFQNTSPESFEGAKLRLDYIIREISRKKIASIPRVLNIGAGNGYLEESAQELGWDIYTLDPDEETINRLKEKGIKGHVGFIERMPFDDESFDFVIASEVLEHLDDDKRQIGIREVFRVIVQGGWFLGTVPYCENLRLNQVVCPKCGEVFHRWGHRKSFDAKTIRDELSLFLDVIDVKRTAFVSFRGRSASGKIKSLIRLVLAKLGSPIAVPSIYFMARKSR
jgi:SAM-dependent methyltransferase